MTNIGRKRFKLSEYAEAAAEARRYARQLNHDVALRKCQEYTSWGYSLSLASRNDSDYARAEIIRPADPI
jgi:hypothetical protein